MKYFFDSKLQKADTFLFEETIVRGILRLKCEKEYTLKSK